MWTAEIVHPPQVMPPWYPPLSDDEPATYHIRTVHFLMLHEAMTRLGAIEASELVDATAIAPETCGRIARRLRALLEGERVSPELFAACRDRWNAFQAEMRAQATARGELVLGGLEDFAYDADSFRNDLVHWGAYCAIAADNGGLVVS